MGGGVILGADTGGQVRANATGVSDVARADNIRNDN